MLILLLDPDIQSIPQWQYTAITWAAMINVLVTTCYAIFSYYLWRATKESVKLTRQMFEAAYSPYIGVQSAELGVWLDDSRPLQILLKNYGNSPVRNLSIKIEYLFDGQLTKSEEIGPNFFPPQAEVLTKTYVSRPESAKSFTLFQVVFDFRYESITDQKYHRWEKYEYRYIDGPLIPIASGEKKEDNISI